jgi:hypothetical protein
VFRRQQVRDRHQYRSVLRGHNRPAEVLLVESFEVGVAEELGFVG